MGFWDGLRTIAGKAINRSSSDVSSDSNRVPYLTSLPHVVSKVSDTVGAQKLTEYFPNPNHRDKIGRVLTVVGKFAVDSTVNESLKGLTGERILFRVGRRDYKIVKEGLKDQSPLHPANGNQKANHPLVIEEMLAKKERLQEELNFIKQQNEASIRCAKELDLAKEALTEPTEASVPQRTDAKKVFIRSRL